MTVIVASGPCAVEAALALSVGMYSDGMTIRSRFRVTPWAPRFFWLKSAEEVADAINRPHEDYPGRVTATHRELERLGRTRLPDSITTELLTEIHAAVFADTDFAGRMKEQDVFLAPEGGPTVSSVHDLMKKLEEAYAGRIQTVAGLKQWYADFQTIHPFPDGNGRTGGIVVAAYSHRMRPGMGWLGPRQ